MNGALLSLELRRVLRNNRRLMLSALLPLIFFLVFTAGVKGEIAGLATGPYLMVSMATYGAMNALFIGGGTIAAERAVGWPRQLRVAGLSPARYVTTKVLIAYVTGIPGLVAVYVVAAAVKHVRLDAGDWVLSAVAILAGLVPVAALGIGVGYSARPTSLQPILGIGSALLALVGGMFTPVTTFPRGLRDAVELLPTYWSADAGRSVLEGGWVGWRGVGVLGAWTVLLGAGAAVLYRRDSLRPGSSGTT